MDPLSLSLSRIANMTENELIEVTRALLQVSPDERKRRAATYLKVTQAVEDAARDKGLDLAPTKKAFREELAAGLEPTPQVQPEPSAVPKKSIDDLPTSEELARRPKLRDATPKEIKDVQALAKNSGMERVLLAQRGLTLPGDNYLLTAEQWAQVDALASKHNVPWGVAREALGLDIAYVSTPTKAQLAEIKRLMASSGLDEQTAAAAIGVKLNPTTRDISSRAARIRQLEAAEQLAPESPVTGPVAATQPATPPSAQKRKTSSKSAAPAAQPSAPAQSFAARMEALPPPPAAKFESSVASAIDNLPGARLFRTMEGMRDMSGNPVVDFDLKTSDELLAEFGSEQKLQAYVDDFIAQATKRTKGFTSFQRGAKGAAKGSLLADVVGSSNQPTHRRFFEVRGGALVPNSNFAVAYGNTVDDLAPFVLENRAGLVLNKLAKVTGAGQEATYPIKLSPNLQKASLSIAQDVVSSYDSAGITAQFSIDAAAKNLVRTVKSYNYAAAGVPVDPKAATELTNLLLSVKAPSTVFEDDFLEFVRNSPDARPLIEATLVTDDYGKSLSQLEKRFQARMVASFQTAAETHVTTQSGRQFTGVEFGKNPFDAILSRDDFTSADAQKLYRNMTINPRGNLLQLARDSLSELGDEVEHPGPAIRRATFLSKLDDKNAVDELLSTKQAELPWRFQRELQQSLLSPNAPDDVAPEVAEAFKSVRNSGLERLSRGKGDLVTAQTLQMLRSNPNVDRDVLRTFVRASLNNAPGATFDKLDDALKLYSTEEGQGSFLPDADRQNLDVFAKRLAQTDTSVPPALPIEGQMTPEEALQQRAARPRYYDTPSGQRSLLPVSQRPLEPSVLDDLATRLSYAQQADTMPFVADAAGNVQRPQSTPPRTFSVNNAGVADFPPTGPIQPEIPGLRPGTEIERWRPGQLVVPTTRELAVPSPLATSGLLDEPILSLDEPGARNVTDADGVIGMLDEPTPKTPLGARVGGAVRNAFPLFDNWSDMSRTGKVVRGAGLAAGASLAAGGMLNDQPGLQDEAASALGGGLLGGIMRAGKSGLKGGLAGAAIALGANVVGDLIGGSGKAEQGEVPPLSLPQVQYQQSMQGAAALDMRFVELEAERKRRLDEIAANYERQQRELTERYDKAQGDEKAYIAWVAADLEAQRNAYAQSINQNYAGIMGRTEQMAAELRQYALDLGSQVQGYYNTAVGQIDAGNAASVDMASSGAFADSGVSSAGAGAMDIRSNTAAEGASQAALATRLMGNAATEMGSLAAANPNIVAAQQGALTALNAQLRREAEERSRDRLTALLSDYTSSQGRLADRETSERMNLEDQLFSLQRQLVESAPTMNYSSAAMGALPAIDLSSVPPEQQTIVRRGLADAVTMAQEMSVNPLFADPGQRVAAWFAWLNNPEGGARYAPYLAALGLYDPYNLDAYFSGSK